MIARFKNSVKDLLLASQVPKARKAIERRALCGIEDELDFVFEGAFSVPFTKTELHIRPIQVRSELRRFMELVQELSPRVVCEIGTAKGGCLYLFSRFACERARLFSIDLPKGRFGGGYPSWKRSLYSSFAREDQELHLLREDSHEQVTLEKLRKLLDGDAIDLLFIDGDHSYEGVKKDFEMYAPLVKNGGTIAFHDIVEGKEQAVGGVPSLWKELMSVHPTEEIVEDPAQGGYGIGLLYWKD